MQKGGKWLDSGKYISKTHKPYLFINECKELTYADDIELFNESKFEEISPYDFIASQGEQMWLPKYGEEALFSDDYKTWQKCIFKSYIPEASHPYYTIPFEGFVCCKPLSKTISFIQFLKDNDAYEAYMHNVKIENHRWDEKEKYKTFEEIKKLHPINWLQAFSWIYTKEGYYFWNKLDTKWEQLYRKNINNIIWE